MPKKPGVSTSLIRRSMVMSTVLHHKEGPDLSHAVLACAMNKVISHDIASLLRHIEVRASAPRIIYFNYLQSKGQRKMSPEGNEMHYIKY